MMSIRTRLERLEETAGRSDGFRRVCMGFQLEGMTEGDAEAKARTEYLAAHGHEPDECIILTWMKPN